MGWEGLRGVVDYFSLRNIFLLGFIVFQLTSGIYALTTKSTGPMTLQDLGGTALTFSWMSFLFLLILLMSYKRHKFVTSMARFVPLGQAVSGVTSLLTLAVVFLVVGILFRHVLVFIPQLGVLLGLFGTGMIAVAAGMAGWVWGPRLLNPFIGLVAGPILIAAVLAAMHHVFGRRELLGVIFCFGWGMWHSHFKHLGPKRAGMWIIIGGLVALMPLAAFTAIRVGNDKVGAGEYAQRLQGASITAGIGRLANGQDVGACAMWLIENYPENFDYRTLATARYFLTNWIPRAWYPNKLEAIGRLMVEQARLRGHADNWSLGPGIIGHIASDNPWIALPLYAVFFGLFLRFVDEIVRLHAGNPFVILPFGVALGNVLGIPRGETSLFLFQVCTSIFAAWFGMYLCAKVMALFGYRFDQGEQVETEWDDGWDYSDEYGAEEPAETYSDRY